jgi:hypothetical protein
MATTLFEGRAHCFWSVRSDLVTLSSNFCFVMRGFGNAGRVLWPTTGTQQPSLIRYCAACMKRMAFPGPSGTICHVSAFYVKPTDSD